MAITSHGPLTAAAEQVVKVIPKENSLGFLGQIGIGLQMLCTGRSRAGEGPALGMAKEQESSAPKGWRSAPGLGTGQGFGTEAQPCPRRRPSPPSNLCLPCKRPCSLREDLFIP